MVQAKAQTSTAVPGTQYDASLHLNSRPADGAALHRDVPPERWCVTRADLRSLRKLVRQSVENGRIKPTDFDPFDVHDQAIGPSFYTVAEQLIKPITEQAGGMSWALMLHPEGLECDLFVTHGWAEGLYEFVDKVLYSWPRGVRHAYCCMLSNPQNLDIGALIQTPRESPFAKALHSATHMLVVPNQTGSIYSRIWCAYEAYFAYSHSKFIFTACAPVRHLERSVVGMLMVEAAGMIFGFVQPGSGLVLNIVHVGSMLLWIVRLGLYPGTLAAVLIHLIGFNMGVCLVWMTDVRRLCVLIGCLVFPSAEVGRRQELQAILEKEALLRGYTGNLRDAQSSLPSDKEAILAELHASGLEEEVDHAVEVLIESGMSTPTLRSASALAGSLPEAGYWNFITLCSCFLLESADLMVGLHDGRGRKEMLVTYGEFLLTCLWLLVFVVISPDKRGFASSAMLRLALTCLFLDIVAQWFLPWGGGVAHKDFLILRSVTLAVWMATIALALAGPGATARIPWIGVPLVRYIMTKNCLCVSTRVQKKLEDERERV